MRLGGIGIATVNIRAWDGATWRNLQVYSGTYPNLRVALYETINAARVFAGNIDGRAATSSGLCTQSFIYGFNGVDWDRIRSDANEHLNVNIGGLAALSYGQVLVDHTISLIKAAKSARKAITIKNIGTETVYVGGAVVTIGNGFKLEAGEALNDIRTTTGIYGVCASGKSTTVCFWEE